MPQQVSILNKTLELIFFTNMTREIILGEDKRNENLKKRNMEIKSFIFIKKTFHTFTSLFIEALFISHDP